MSQAGPPQACDTVTGLPSLTEPLLPSTSALSALLSFSATSRHRTAALATALSLAVLLAWDASGLDLWLAGLSASTAGFPLRNHPFLTVVLHDGARLLTAVLLVMLALSTARPFGPLRQLDLRHRLWLLAAVSTGMLLVSAIKRLTLTDCPWELAAFGGQLPFVSHWNWGVMAGDRPGHCFPAGHASAGFAWVAGWFAWPRGSRTGRRWLAASLAAGLVLGVAQQLRGAHFMSHTLWTAWACWTWSWALSLLLPRGDGRTGDPDAPAAH